MAKSKSTSRSGSRSKAAPAPRKAFLSAKSRRAIINGLVAFIVIVVVSGGLYVLKNYVGRDLAFSDAPPQIVLKNRPTWMSDFLADRIIRSVAPTGTHSALDTQVLADTVDILKVNPWISEVRNVRRAYAHHPGDTIEIDCDFRTPVALVKSEKFYWLVDSDGIKLPEQYTADLVPKVVMDAQRRPNIRIIEGVKELPPEPGQVWKGDDLAAGLDMIKLLFGQPYADDVVKVNVGNYAGRVDVREAQVVLITKWDTQVRWGRSVHAADFFIEAPTSRKLQYLQDVYAQYKRLDAGYPWIDIRFDKVTYPAPTPAPGKDAQSASAR